MGDGERLTIFKYELQGKVENIGKLCTRNERNVEIEVVVSKILSNLKIDKEYYIDFERTYLYYTQTKDSSSTIFLIFFPETQLLYIIEDIY